MSELILNMPFTTLNNYIEAERANRYKAANIKKRQTASVAYLAKEQKFKVEECKHDLIITWYKPNDRSDHDNISFAQKFILDGLKLAKVIPDDSPRYICNILHLFELDKTRSYISCKVKFIYDGYLKKLIS